MDEVFENRLLAGLFALGVLMAVAGIILGRDFLVAAGLIAVIIAALGRGLTHLNVNIWKGQITIKRYVVREAARGRALATGVDRQAAEEIAEDLSQQVPAKGARVEVSKAGTASTTLSGGGTIEVMVGADESPVEAIADAIVDRGFLLCNRCGFHVPATGADYEEGQYCPACGHDVLERIGPPARR